MLPHGLDAAAASVELWARMKEGVIVLSVVIAIDITVTLLSPFITIDIANTIARDIITITITIAITIAIASANGTTAMTITSTWQCWQDRHRLKGTSSPPTWMYLLGNKAITYS